jgi:hypothetical protein
VAAAILASAVFVSFRSLVWLGWPQSYFDADQAIYGLMAKHISEGRAFPLFMYGQNYTLAIDAWLAAPLFAVAGPSVLALKLPVFVLNVVIAALLTWLLLRDARLSPLQACVAGAFFTLAAPLSSSRLLEASGGNIATLFFALAAWMLRRRPILLGLTVGVALANRDFTWYLVIALLAVEWLDGGLLTRPRILSWARTAAIAAGVALAFNVIARAGSVLGPGTAGTGFGPLQIRKPGAFGCFDTGELASNFDWVLRGNLAAQFGWEPELPSAYSVTSTLVLGHAWAVWPLLVLLASLAIAAAFSLRPMSRPRDAARLSAHASGFAVYLILIGVQCVVAYGALTCDVEQPTLLRYTLLSLFGAVGAAAWLLGRERAPLVRGLTLACVALWAAASAWDSTRLLDEYLHRPPPDAPAVLVDALDRRGIRFGRGSYWTAYVVAFRSRERIVVAADRYPRIAAYQRQVDAEPPAAVVRIEMAPCAAADETVAGWCISPADGRRQP